MFNGQSFVAASHGSQLQIVNYSLSIIHCPLSIIHCPLSIVHYSLSIVHYSLSIVHFFINVRQVCKQRTEGLHCLSGFFRNVFALQFQ